MAIEDVLGRMEFAVTNSVDYEAINDIRSRCIWYSLATEDRPNPVILVVFASLAVPHLQVLW